MPTIFEHKELAATETPILLFDCELGSGTVERWSTHAVTVDGQDYEARVLRHNLFELRAASDMGVDAIPRAAITLANADSRFSAIERTVGWKGASVTVRFLFYKLREGAAETESLILFRGVANPPEEITESTFRLSAVNRMSMQRVLLPPVRVQRRCPWDFPATATQREEAVHGGPEGPYSRFFRCGYSADIAGGVGNLDGAAPFTSCHFTKADCQARGMFREDSALNPTRRFGGIEFVPAQILVRSHGEKGTHVSPLTENEARYNDFVPLVYGTAWHAPLIVFARNDGNLTHLEVLLCMGEIDGVIKVLVNDFEIPTGESGKDMTGTGWYNVVSLGNRTGDFNLDFADSIGAPQGDPYGSMAYLSVVIPNRINDGRSLPSVKALLRGLKLPVYAGDGSFVDLQFTNNPAWVLMDVLRRCGWSIAELDIPSFAAAAAYCGEEINTTDLYGNPVTTPRFQCNLTLKKRRTAADVIRGIRNGSRLYLTYSGGGLLQLRVENALALQQPVKPESSNSESTLDGGWPAYEFGDGSGGTTGILRRENGEPAVRLWSRSTSDTPNRFAVEFQDAFNEYQQDSLSVSDVEDIAATGQEITGPFSADGIPHYDQAARILKFNLDRSIEGNTYVELETSVRAVGLKPGDIIAITYLKEGFVRQPFRILRIAPGVNYRTASLTAQIHDDDWYLDTNGQTETEGRRPYDPSLGVPRPLIGTVVDEHGDVQFGIEETESGETDGGSTVRANVSFYVPATPSLTPVGIPLVSFAPTISTSGTLAGNQTLYYALSAVNAAGEESALSFVVRASIPSGAADKSVTLEGLSFSSATEAFHVYRGPSPWQLYRIASGQPVAAQFTDSGLVEQLATPPDPNYHHANFYWRREMQPEYPATIHSTTTIGNGSLEMAPDAHHGAVVRITRGKGARQERPVLSNTSTTLTLMRGWAVEPDATSFFVVAESGWRFGATGATSPVAFEIPNREGETIHVMGLAANANDVKSPEELATVTRWVIGGAGGGSPDTDVPPEPTFGLALIPNRGGYVEVGGIGFAELENTQTISAATFTIYYFHELDGQPEERLAAAIDGAEEVFALTSAGPAGPGSYIQIDQEVMRVDGVLNGGLTYHVTRGVHGSTATAHAVDARIYSLKSKVAIAAFGRDFFGSPASGGWGTAVLLPDARVASAELFVTNSRGASPVASVSVTGTVDSGLRTCSGGQYSIQVGSFLAIENGAAPELVVEATHSVRDVFAVVRFAPSDSPVGVRINVDGDEYCTLTIPAGGLASAAVDGFLLPALTEGARVSVDVTSVGGTHPGADLTVTIRL